jgi:hypothetical protein
MRKSGKRARKKEDQFVHLAFDDQYSWSNQVDDVRYEQLKKKILDVNAVVSKLDRAIRGEAFALMKPYLSSRFDSRHSEAKAKPVEQESKAGPLPVAALVAAPTDGTPAENVVLIAAHL